MYKKVSTYKGYLTKIKNNQKHFLIEFKVNNREYNIPAYYCSEHHFDYAHKRLCNFVKKDIHPIFDNIEFIPQEKEILVIYDNELNYREFGMINTSGELFSPEIVFSLPFGKNSIRDRAYPFQNKELLSINQQIAEENAAISYIAKELNDENIDILAQSLKFYNSVKNKLILDNHLIQEKPVKKHKI